MKKILLITALTLTCLVGCTKEKPQEPTQSPIQTIEPTTAPELNDPIAPTEEALIAPEVEAPTMYVGGTDGALVEVTPGMDSSEIDDPVARSNYELSLGIENGTEASETTESTEASESTESLTGDTENVEGTVESDETMSYNDWEGLDEAIREHNQKEVEEWFKEAGWE